MPTVVIGKHCREAEESHDDGGPVGIDSNEMPPQKRARGWCTDGVPEAAQAVPRTCQKPAAENTKDENAHIEMRRGGERFVPNQTSNAQGVYRRPLLRSSLNHGYAVDAPDGQMIWYVEGSVEEEAEHDNTVQQQRQEKTEDRQFKFPKVFEKEQKALLVATETDWACGAIREIKCRLCPDTKLKTWEDFKRHCNTMEAHPLKISFCKHCGDFFARKDSLKRHHENPPAECVSVAPEKAAVKRKETQRLHEQFRVRLEEGLEKHEDIGIPFSQIIKNLYPESSKKRTGGSSLSGR